MRATRVVFGLFLLLTVLLPAVAIAQVEAPRDSTDGGLVASVDQAVTDQLADEGEAAVWIVLRAHANTPRAATMRDWI